MPERKHPLFQNKRLSLPPVYGMNLRRLIPNVCPTCPHLIMEKNVKVTWGAVSENGRGAWISTFAASICSHRSQTPVCKARVRFQVTMMICKNENNVQLWSQPAFPRDKVTNVSSFASKTVREALQLTDEEKAPSWTQFVRFTIPKKVKPPNQTNLDSLNPNDVRNTQ